MKLKSKILLLCLTCSVFALVLQTVLYQQTSSSLIYEQAKSERVNYLQNMQNELYSYIRSVENKMIDIYNQAEIMQVLRSDADTEEMKTELNRAAYRAATTQFDSKDFVLSFYLYNNEHELLSRYVRASTPSHSYPVDIYSDMVGNNAKVVLDYINSDNADILISSYYNKNRDKDILRFVLKLYHNRILNETVGYVICDVDIRVISEIMKKYLTDENMYIWLQPENDRPAVKIGSLSEKEESIYNNVSWEMKNGNTEQIGQFKANHELFDAVQKKYNLSAFSLMPQEILEKNQRALTSNLIAITFLIIILAAIITLSMSKNLTKSLDALMATINQIKDGDTKIRANIKAKDEIGELGDNFNEMLDRIEELAEKENKTNLLLSDAQYKALQAQINPHFLYNTLDTMSSIAEVMNCPEVSQMSQALSNIFRYALNMKEHFSTISKEIVHLQNYTYVMNVRMQDNVEYSFDIQENLLSKEIPRMSIQPLVENALNHGLRNKKGKKKITIEAKEADGNINIIVSDNGVGFDDREVNKKFEENSLDYVHKGDSIGMFNINARLKMLYGQSYGLVVKSKENFGTSVYMIIPKDKGGEDKNESEKV